jgi:membrane-bound lytic murein transglycosylase B
LAAFPPFSGGAVLAQTPMSQLERGGFQAYLPQLRARAVRSGVSQRTLDQVFTSLQFSRRTVELDQAQPAARPEAARSRRSSPIAPSTSAPT